MNRYDWRAISGNLISEAGKLLAEVGAKDRFDELQRAAEASVATAREQEPAQQLDEDQASDAREGHPEENLHDLVAELIAEDRNQRQETRMQLPGGTARNADDYVSLDFELVTVLLTLAALIVPLLPTNRADSIGASATIVIEAPDRAPPKGAPPARTNPHSGGEMRRRGPGRKAPRP